MLTGLRDCLVDAKDLLKSSLLDFDITQFELIKIEEFATTHYGLELVKGYLKNHGTNSDNSRSTLESELLMVCENLLTYTVGDCCYMQSEFHWYYCIEGEFVYKESEMNVIVVPSGKEIFGSSRVAKISELPSNMYSSLIWAIVPDKVSEVRPDFVDREEY